MNPDCDEKHLTKNCPKTSTGKEKERLNALRSRRTKGKEGAKVLAHLQPSVSAAPFKQKTHSAKPAMVLPDLQRHRFAWRTDSGADQLIIPSTTVHFLSNRGVFLPTVMLSKAQRILNIDGSPVDAEAKIQLYPTLETVAGPCHSRKINAFVMPCNDIHLIQGAACPGELVLGNPLITRTGLDIKEFIADYISRLSLIDFDDLCREEEPTTTGKLSVKLLTQTHLVPFPFSEGNALVRSRIR